MDSRNFLNKIGSCIPAVFSALALSMALSACNQRDQPFTPAAASGESHPGFAREMIALKAKGLDEAGRGTAVRALLARYGKVVPHAATSNEEKFSPVPTGADGASALAKSAAVKRWKLIRTSFLEFPFVLKFNANVPNGKTISASTALGAGGDFTDPFLVGFYQSVGLIGPKAYPIKVVGFNDDRNGNTLNASFTWTNNTGALQFVEIICFAFSPETGGAMKLTVTYPKLGGGIVTESVGHVNVTGVAKYNDEFGPFAGCSPSTSTRITLDPSVGFITEHAILAVNATSMTGGLIRRNMATLTLDRFLPSGYPNLFLGYIPWAGDIGDNETQYYATQESLYSCAQ